MFRRNYISVTREGWCYLVVLAFIITGAILREINLLIIVMGMMIGPFLFNWWMVTLTLHAVDIRRKLPKHVCAGDLLVVELTATNARRRTGSTAVVVEDAICREGVSGSEGRAKAVVMFPLVRARETSQLAYRGRLMQRGRYTFGPLYVSTRFPLGLVRRRIALDHTDQLLVCPRLGQLTPKWKRLVQTRRIGSYQTRQRHGLLEGDFYGLRDYRRGDSRRWIHWRTSAKRGTLKVRQFELQRTQNLALMVNLWQPAAPTPEQQDNVELAISFAATIVEDLCRRGSSQLMLGVAGKANTRVHGAASMVLLQEVMEQLAAVQADPGDQLPQLVNGALDEIRPATVGVIISTCAVDVADTERFTTIWEDPQKRNRFSQFITVDVSDNELPEHFGVS